MAEDDKDWFAPADGEQARWRYAYALVTSKKPHDEITLHELADLLGMEFNPLSKEQRGILFSAMREAKIRLEREGLPSVKTVERFGWVVLDAGGSLDEVERRRTKSARAVNRSVRLLLGTDRSQLTQHQRARMDFLASQLAGAAALYNRRPKTFDELEKLSRERQKRIGR